MRHWNSRRLLFHFTVVLVMMLSLALVGCSDDDDGGAEDTVAADVAGRTFNFADCSVIDPGFPAQACTLTFGAAVANDTVPFVLTIGANRLTGNATVASIELLIGAINGVSTAGTSVTIGTRTVRVGDVLELDAETEESDGTDVITITNPTTGRSAVFTFTGTNTGATGTTGN